MPEETYLCTSHLIMKKILWLLGFCFTSLLHGQGYHLGLRIGLNYSMLEGPLEENASFGTAPGFHIGPVFSYAFSDIMGLRGEVIFSQKGSKFDYSGPSYFTIRKNNDFITTNGNRTMKSVINNNYLDIPLMFYTLLFERVDVSVGGYASILVGSTGRGDLVYSGKRDNSNAPVGPIKFLLDQNFFKDRAGTTSSSVTQTIRLEGDQIVLPERLGGYYEYRTKPDGNKYNSLDYGLAGAIHYRLCRGLYAGVRYQWGIADISNDTFEVSYKTLSPTKEFILVPAKQQHRGLQVSLMLQL